MLAAHRAGLKRVILPKRNEKVGQIGTVIQQLVDEFGLKWEGSVEKRWLLHREWGGGKGSHQRRGGSKLERWYRGVLVWDRKLIKEG